MPQLADMNHREKRVVVAISAQVETKTLGVPSYLFGDGQTTGSLVASQTKVLL